MEKVHGKHKDEKFGAIKVFASIFRKKFYLERIHK